MTFANPQLSLASRPRVGIPWRTLAEQRNQKRDKLDQYFDAVRRAGADPREIRLDQRSEDLERHLQEFDGFVLPGSPADVNPSCYHEPKLSETKIIDDDRDK